MERKAKPILLNYIGLEDKKTSGRRGVFSLDFPSYRTLQAIHGITFGSPVIQTQFRSSDNFRATCP